MEKQSLKITRDIYDHSDPEKLVFKAEAGISEALVRQISKDKGEPEWMLKRRLEALDFFKELPMPNFGPSLSDLNLEDIHLYIKPEAKKNSESWADVPEDIKKTYEKLGIPEAEREALAGVGAQYESEVVYHKLKKQWEDKGVVFLDCDIGLQKYPELFKKYFMTTCIPVNLHKFTALHGAFWSGGTFIYVPKEVKVDLPLQAYFRMNAKKGGQFEHTLIIADEGSEVHYIEGCSAPLYSENSLHAGCVEIHVLKNARVRYSSIENWSKNVYNLNTKRGVVYENGLMEWVNGNTGCLTGNSKIFTNPGGPIEIKNLKEGDKVYAWDENTNSLKTSKVKNKIFSGNKEIYKLSAAGREIEASSNHPFLTLIREKNKPDHKKKFFKFSWKPLKELKTGDLVGITKKLPHLGRPNRLPEIKVGEEIDSKNQYSPFKMNTSYLYNKKINYPKETNEDFMWLMGLILGDGHIDMKYNKINIATHEKEDYRNKLIKLLKELFNYEVTEKKKGIL